MKYPLWKPVLILVVLLGCAALLLLKDGDPKTIDLKAGIDLAGGTTLVYDVLVPEGKDAESVIDDTIAIQKDRVDASGVKNLVWRPEAGNRLSVTMAQAGPIVQEKRDAFDEQRKALLANTLDVAGIDSAVLLEDAAARRAEFEKLAKNDPALVEKLTRLAELSAERDALQEPYESANDAWRAAQAEFGDSPTDEQQARLDTLFAELNQTAAAFSEARDAVLAARRDILAGSVSEVEVDRILALSNEKRTGASASPREQALTAFKEQHKAQAEQIDAVAAAWAEYERVKGPLDDPEDLIRMLRGAGVLEFRIAATPAVAGQQARPVDISSYAQRLDEKGPRAGLTEDWRWFKVQSVEKFFDSREGLNELLENPESAAPSMFASRGLVGRAYGGDFYVLLANTPGMAMTGADDWTLTSTTRQQDELGRPSVGFALDGQGAALMGQLTGGNVGRQMAIVLDGELMSAPTLQAQLTSGGTITGEFNSAEYQYLLNTLGAGSLEGQLSYDPISQKTTGPALGQDNLQKGLTACITALIVVAIFMAFYYLFAGLVADFALVANMIIILGIMSMIEATFTLPGIAGLVLTIGMAVDANVLIFERIREETEAKADLPTAVRLGFGKALSTILDANITTLITCVVLGYTATAEVKGFAVVLGVGILATLFTALFSTRVIVDLYLILTKAKTLPMLPTLVPAIRKLLSPETNWIGKRKLFLPISVVLIIAGLCTVYYRGEDLLDIEFRSGTEVTFTLSDETTLPIDEVRSRLENFGQTPAAAEIDARVETQIERANAENADVEGDQQPVPTKPDWDLLGEAQIVTVGDPTPNGEAAGFSVATLIENSSAVSDAIKAIFRDELDVTESIDFTGQDLTVGQARGIVEPIVAGSLYESLGRQFSERSPDVRDFVGGVSIVLENLAPAVSIQDVEERISRMRRQPAYEMLGSRPFAVFGLERAGTDKKGDPSYATIAVVVKDRETNYAEDRSQFSADLGLAQTEWALVRDALQRDTSLASVSNFSSQVSGTMKQQAIVAMVLSLLAVVAYIWLRFGSLRYGLAAIAALVHDISITLGILAICGWLVEIPGFHQALLLDNFKINLALVAALLTIVGYSLNDTIVVFDRIRENRGRLSRATPAIINDSINQTISRTVLTSGTTLIAVLTLYILGGPGVHGFAFAMLVGVLVGTYSSIAIAAPMLLIGDKSGGAGSGVAATDQPASPAGSTSAIPSAAATTR